MDIVKDEKEFKKGFPLFAAVNRAANGKAEYWIYGDDYDESDLVVDRHQGRLIFLEYTGEGEINTTVMLVGKGITYDTGGLDIKGKETISSSLV